MMSFGPPGAKPTMTRTGRDGYACARASSASAARIRARKKRTLFRLDARRFERGGDARRFQLHALEHVGGRAVLGRYAEVRVFFLHVGELDDATELRVEAPDDRLGCSLRREDRPPHAGLVV